MRWGYGFGKIFNSLARYAVPIFQHTVEVVVKNSNAKYLAAKKQQKIFCTKEQEGFSMVMGKTSKNLEFNLKR